MELSEMNLLDVEERLKVLDEEVRAMSEVAEVEKATEEKKRLLERKAELVDLEERKKAAELLSANEIKADKIIERNEDKTMEIETRNTLEYGKAFVKAIMSGDDSECRALLSANASGSVPVPEALDNEIRNAWNDCQIMSLVKKTNYPGNVKVGFEYSATGAVIHTEGAAAPDEETLVWGTVELKAESIKKWITVSDEAIDNTTIDTLQEIYKEVAQRIVEKAEEVAIGKIVAAATTGMTTTCAGAQVYTAATLGVDTITMALAELSGKAKNVTLAMNRRTYAAFLAAAKANKFAVDVFDGCKVVFTDALKPYGTATTGDTYVIAGDFGYGFQANFPNGNDIKLIVDEKSLAEKDLVKIVGRQFVGMDVVAPKAFVCVQK